MSIRELINQIALKHEGKVDIHPPAKLQDFELFRKTTGINLPLDFLEFYSTCNGFSCVEDTFQMKPIAEMIDYPEKFGPDWVHFADYLINSDMWTLRTHKNETYEILNWGLKGEIILTGNLSEFLERYLEGDVFDKGGLYDWQEAVFLKTNAN